MPSGPCSSRCFRRRPARPGGGHPECHCRREIVDAIRYLVDQGCKWRGLQRDFAPWKRVYAYFLCWEKACVTEHLVDEPRRRVRAAAGRDPQPRRDHRLPVRAHRRHGRSGHVRRGQRQVGLLIRVFAGPANLQDRDARVLLGLLHLVCPTVKPVWADGGYAGQLVKAAKRYWSLTAQILKRTDAMEGFVVLPR